MSELSLQLFNFLSLLRLLGVFLPLQLLSLGFFEYEGLVQLIFFGAQSVFGPGAEGFA